MMATNPSDEVKNKMQEIARTVKKMIPEGCGFAVLVFDTGDKPGRRLNYVSNCKRDDIVRAMEEFIDVTDDERFGTHEP